MKNGNLLVSGVDQRLQHIIFLIFRLFPRLDRVVENFFHPQVGFVTLLEARKRKPGWQKPRHVSEATVEVPVELRHFLVQDATDFFPWKRDGPECEK